MHQIHLVHKHTDIQTFYKRFRGKAAWVVFNMREISASLVDRWQIPPQYRGRKNNRFSGVPGALFGMNPAGMAVAL